MTQSDTKVDELEREIVQELSKGFFSQLTLLKGLASTELEQPAQDTKILLASMCTTGTALKELSDNPQYFFNEAVMLGRSFLEKGVNFCYLQVCDDEERKRFLLHPFYRMYHNADRSKYADELKLSLSFTGKDELKKIQRVQDALECFSETNHKKAWSERNLDEKIGFIAKNSKLEIGILLLNSISIYSHASEALHGSLYGCALATGAYFPDVDSSDQSEVMLRLFKETALLYVQLSSLIHEIFRLLSESNEEAAQLLGYSQKNQEVAVSLLKALFKIELEMQEPPTERGPDGSAR